jgi:hypothetical protein
MKEAGQPQGCAGVRLCLFESQPRSSRVLNRMKLVGRCGRYHKISY